MLKRPGTFQVFITSEKSESAGMYFWPKALTYDVSIVFFELVFHDICRWINVLVLEGSLIVGIFIFKSPFQGRYSWSLGQ